MLKVAVASRRRPASNSLADFQNQLVQRHGPLVGRASRILRYVQHPSLPEAYGHSYAPTFDDVSLFWVEDAREWFTTPTTPEELELEREIAESDARLFDRNPAFPAHERRATVVANEVVIMDGPIDAGMVKTLVFACRLPGLTHREFFAHWREVHGSLAMDVPGLRRYVQNHATPEAFAWGRQTHDGWAEMWFDTLDDVYTALASPEWSRLRDDGDMTFTRSMGVGIGRERVQKDFHEQLPP